MQYKRIKELREDNDLKQREVASALHCSQQAYSNYENGQRDIPTDVLIRLSSYYNVSTDYILGISESEYKAETPEDRYKVPGLH